MATWIAHMRLAQNVLDYGFELAVEPFLVGNIGADSGVPDENGVWRPSKAVTHWYDINDNIQPEAFYRKYLENANLAEMSLEKYAFLMGYYCHLVADIEWVAQIWQPLKRQEHWQAVLNAPNPDYWTIKKDWYGQDFIYLREHPDNLYAKVFKHIESFPDYLDYLPDGALLGAVKQIRDYYENEESQQLSYAHDYPFLDTMSMDAYVECTTVTMLALLHGKGVPCPNPRPLSAYGIRPVA